MGQGNNQALAAGILGVGIYLPETIRHNDWWPATVVDRWRHKALHNIDNISLARTDGVERALAEMAKLSDDPFNGAVERRVMRPDELSSEMEIEAGKRALKNACVRPEEIDMLITFSVCPDYLAGPWGAIVHERLGLPKRCFTLSVDGACNTFPGQLTMADQAIRSGRARRVLLVTSSAYSKLIPVEASIGAWMGDAASAVVLGAVSGGRGILSYTHGTEGAGYRAMVFGVPGKRWYDEGRTICYSEDKAMAQAIIVGAVDRCKEVVTDALAQIDLTPADVDFYAGHQGGPWLRRVTQEFSGMHRARSLDTFERFGNLGAVNIPLIWSIAEHEGLLRDRDLVATFSAGNGQTYSSVVLRWGHD
jgi:3-oxoacyl-[acyl-carrier-protein] synthase-3